MSHKFKVNDYAFHPKRGQFYRIMSVGDDTSTIVAALTLSGLGKGGSAHTLITTDLVPVDSDNPLLQAAMHTDAKSPEEQFDAVKKLLNWLQVKGGLGGDVHDEITRVQAMLTGPFVKTVGEPAQPSSDLTPDDVLDTAVVVLTELYRADPAAAYLLATVKYPTTTALTEHATIICNPLLIADREEDPIAAVGMVGVLNGILLRLGTSQRLASRWTKSLPEKFLGFTKMPIE